MNGVTVVNFSHPLTAPQIADVERRLEQRVARVLDVPTQFDQDRSFEEQSRTLLDAIDLDWESAPLVVNLPSLAPIAAVVLARLHGWMGHFPTIIRVSPIEGSVPRQFHVAEIIELNAPRIRPAQRDAVGKEKS